MPQFYHFIIIIIVLINTVGVNCNQLLIFTKLDCLLLCLWAVVEATAEKVVVASKTVLVLKHR